MNLCRLIIVKRYIVCIGVVLYYHFIPNSDPSDTGTVPSNSSIDDRSSILSRQTLIERIGLSRAAHLYIISQPLSTIHTSFDAVLIKLLLQDR